MASCPMSWREVNTERLQDSKSFLIFSFVHTLTESASQIGFDDWHGGEASDVVVIVMVFKRIVMIIYPMALDFNQVRYHLRYPFY